MRTQLHFGGISTPGAAALLLGLAALLGGCASKAIQAEWSDPQFAGHSLSGEKVLVVCDAAETAVRRICEEQMTARLSAAGTIAVSSGLGAAGAKSTRDEMLAVARSAGAKAILASSLAPDSTVVNPGPTFGIGVGGFGGSRGGVGAGVGVTVPVGSEQVSTAYGADMALTDVATGKLMWTGKVSTPASQDVTRQIGKLAEAGVAAAQKAGML